MNKEEAVKSLGDLINAAGAVVCHVQSVSNQVTGNKNIFWRYVDELPPASVMYDVSEGYLAYDINNELFAGATGRWNRRARDLLIPEESYDPLNIITGAPIHAWETTSEVVLVPCKSYEARLEDRLYIRQEFDWRGAIKIKSENGVLSVIVE
jgi:hypothetical protein